MRLLLDTRADRCSSSSPSPPRTAFRARSGGTHANHHRLKHRRGLRRDAAGRGTENGGSLERAGLLRPDGSVGSPGGSSQTAVGEKRPDAGAGGHDRCRHSFGARVHLDYRQPQRFSDGRSGEVQSAMITTLTLDKAGRIVLPNAVRDEMQLRPGDSLEVETSEDRIILRPRRTGVRLRRKQGVWVLSTGRPISAGATDDILREIRDERELRFMGSLAPCASRRKKRS